VLAFSPILSPALSATEGNENQKQNPKPSEAGIARLTQEKQSCAQHTQNRFTAFDLPSPVRPPSSAGWSGEVGEDCLSAQREFRSRLTS
jgi:hypothetical protein